MIDNSSPPANGNGSVTQFAVSPAAPLGAPDEVGASPETLLFRTGLLSPDQLGELVQERVASGSSVEEIVVARGWLDADTVARALGGETAAAPALEPHPDPFALPVVELRVEPLPIAAASFAPAPEHLPVAAPSPDPFAIPAEPVVVEPVAPVIAPFANPVAHEPVEIAHQELTPLAVEPTGFEPAGFELAALEPAPLDPAVPEQAPELPAAGVEFRVSIRFVGNDCVEIAGYADADEAKTAAHAVVAQLSSERGDWPFVGGRFVRPDAVLSVDVDAIVR